jgi:hypothetical protein
MPKLKKIVVIHTTVNDPPADSDAEFTLEIARSGSGFSRRFPNKPNQRQLGRTDLYQFDVSDKDVDSGDEHLRISMKINEDNGWLPQSIFVLGETLDGQGIILGYHRQWPGDGWFGGLFPGHREKHLISS